jgi:glucose 1-dehydrogenase
MNDAPTNPDRTFPLHGKTALVTGANAGIGRAIAEGFAAAGAQVWVHARTEVKARSVAAAIGGRLVAADLARRDEIERMVGELRQRMPSLDVLVNNAGMEKPMRLSQLDLAVADQVMQVNALAPAQLIQGLLPLFPSRGGSIINVTSIHDQVPYPGNAAYCMSKAALAMLTKTLALELAPRRIRVNNLAPGAIETDINRAVLDTIGRERFAAWIPAGRVGSVDEVVGPATFLASDASSYCTGATLYADGGYMQHIVRYTPDEHPER